MKVLLVEDHPDEVDAILNAFPNGIDFVVAFCRDDALAIMDDNQFDLAVCDLKIPPTSGATPEVEHGLAVLTSFRAMSPGTPVVAFTAHRTTEVMALLLGEQRQEDFLGTLADRSMLSAIDKDELPEFLELLDELRAHFAALDQIQVVTTLDGRQLDASTERILRIFARRRDCTISRVSEFDAGQSGATVLRIKMEKADGAAGGVAVARIVSVQDVAEERRRYQQRVSGFLGIGSYAEIVDDVRAGAAQTGGVFYQIAEGYSHLYGVLEHSDETAAAAVDRLHAIQEPWRDGAPAVDVEVGEIRRSLIRDARWADHQSRCGLDVARVQAIENVVVPVRRATIHGDLHGDNVLVDADPVMIDFVSVQDGPTPMDAVTLELSLLFHPHAPRWAGPWPTEDQLANWADFSAYAAGAPYPLFLEACRRWAKDVARGNRDLHACRYAYVASQARFATSSDPRLRALLSDLPNVLF